MTPGSDSSRLRQLLWEHPALLASALYIIASAIGMGFSWVFLGRFGIDVFQYVQVGDFLLASLKEPMIWVLVGASLLLVVLDRRGSRRWGRKARSAWTRWYGSERYRQVAYLLMPLLVGLYIYAWAIYKADRAFAGEGTMISVTLSDAGTARKALLLDTTSSFVFLFDPPSRRVTILPHESVGSISYAVPER